jgi:hypothetical protein
MNNKVRSLFFITLLIITFQLEVNAQAAKPRIMIFPANFWMKSKNYFTTVNNQGKVEDVMDYQKAFNNDKELYSVMNKIGQLMADRGFALEDMASKLKDISEQNALNNMDQNSSGGGIAESPRDKLLKVAKPDIILELSWTVNIQGPKKYLTFDLKGIDAGTNKPIASAGGPGTPSFSADVPVLLQEAVLSQLDNFNAQLMNHFKDMFENGREISLDIKVWDNSPKKLNDEINDDGDQLKDDIKKWVKNNTVKGRFTLSNSSPSFMSFTQVRIPIYDEDNAAFDADGFATKLRKYLRKNYQLQSEASAIGLGKAEVAIGGKR